MTSTSRSHLLKARTADAAGKFVAGRRRLIAGFLSAASVLMVGGAAWLAAYPFVSDWRAHQRQEVLRADFVSGLPVRSVGGVVAEGSPVTRIVISKLGVDTIVVEGTSLDALIAGAGHYRGTPLPGEPGNVAIAGHRTMHGKPFADLAHLSVGDRIDLITPFGRHTYEVKRPPFVVGPRDASVLEPGPEPMLTLTTCHPKGSSKQRLVAQARLITSETVQ